MYSKDPCPVVLRIPTSVVGQISCIVDHFSTEVSWFGDITQDGNVLTIENVYLFPQVVTGGTFRTDDPQVDKKYDEWYEKKLEEMADHFEKTGEVKNIMQYNGHSHVNAGCTPSGEDIRFRKSREGLNIYSIQNKHGKSDWEVWTDDMVYENDDIKIQYVDDIFEKADEYVLKPIVKPHVGSAAPGYTGAYAGGYTKPASATTAASVKHNAQQAQQKKIKEEERESPEARIIPMDAMSEVEIAKLQEELWRENWEEYGFGADYYGHGYSFR